MIVIIERERQYGVLTTADHLPFSPNWRADVSGYAGHPSGFALDLSLVQTNVGI